MPNRKIWWVGVLAGCYENHEVFQHSGTPSKKEFPQYSYIVGPFYKKREAKLRAKTEKNNVNMFEEPRRCETIRQS